jgi:hypothetical protein
MVDVFRKQGWKVALMDIGGIHRDGMDLLNTNIAWEVMGVPCTKGRVDRWTGHDSRSKKEGSSTPQPEYQYSSSRAPQQPPGQIF